MSTAPKLKGLDIYTIVTNRIIKQLESGIIPWHTSFYEQGQPQNLVTWRPYTGLNTWLLASLGYKRNLFLTWKQIRDMGLSVKPRQKGNMVVYWIPGTPEKKLRYYMVFNVAQTTMPREKIPPVEQITDPNKACMDIVNGMPNAPMVQEWSSSLFYSTITDHIQMPEPEYFAKNEDYFSALFYALIHATGHPSRLNRLACMNIPPLSARQYNRSHLTWEMGAAYLCSIAGIPPVFLKKYAYESTGWLQVFSTDKKMIMDAAQDALQAVQYILNTTIDEKPDEEIMELSEGL